MRTSDTPDQHYKSIRSNTPKEFYRNSLPQPSPEITHRTSILRNPISRTLSVSTGKHTTEERESMVLQDKTLASSSAINVFNVGARVSPDVVENNW
jgi:hypothetical protein